MENVTGITSKPEVHWYSDVSFSWYDYVLFLGMLISSALIGIYFGCFGSKQSSAKEYLLGGKEMKIFPIAMSLVASHISGVTLLAVPADVYSFGATYWLSAIGIFAVCGLTSLIYLPVFYNLQLTSAYEYLSMRFNKKIRVFASFLFATSVIMFLPIVIYIPALAFSQATGANIHYITPFVCGICIFYTTIGGLKAVVWTDTLQFTVTVGAMIVVFIVGTISAGGITAVFKKAYEGQRLDISFDWDPTQRDTFWAMSIGWTTYWISHVSINQGCIQKFLSLPTLADAHKAVLLFACGITLVKSASVVTGLIMYAKYSGCDPFTTGRVKQPDQLLPYYVMDVAGHIPGLPGLFIAGVFCTALSTLSATLNCLAGTIYEDFVKHFMPKTTTPKTTSNILKLIVVIVGVTSTSLVFIVAQLGEILALSISLSSVTSGTLLGVFTLGIMFPKVNSTGALTGSIVSTIVIFWLVMGANWYKLRGLLKYPRKPISVESCDFEFTPRNSTMADAPEEIFYLYRLTYYYYSLLGAAIVILIGVPISKLTRKKDEPPVSKELLTPYVHFLLEEKQNINYYSVDQALHIVASNTKNEE